ncbi:uncharacterized protein NDAI_0I01420 [Naumovozyma dairenensis CBS 421]|uniref:Uncharacterized protein n=1 Tax=Naumovozyma dairenensis (strain ATCC 10597 / BCRC 20456 / CBS 421 / NBRC 0211 / NRRL Y-12639) TaxID=1071378 RepID=G0WG00_NAUDC|nr:hypothetical protein NDAI_0I01420 [Naumovozyma dairenensis CBS 421]CCD26711.1 hypothetical protein NDAI_0I01420 [Naumovozyma dairenensis CBS 421]
MGICASKTDSPTTTTTATTTTNTNKPVQRIRPKHNKNAEETTKGTRKKKTVAAVQTSGTKLGAATNDDDDGGKLSPKEAARLAAEKRFKEATEKETKGELGKKLASERAKTYKAHVLEDAEKRNLERERENLTFD